MFKYLSFVFVVSLVAAEGADAQFVNQQNGAAPSVSAPRAANSGQASAPRARRPRAPRGEPALVLAPVPGPTVIRGGAGRLRHFCDASFNTSEFRPSADDQFVCGRINELQIGSVSPDSAGVSAIAVLASVARSYGLSEPAPSHGPGTYLAAIRAAQQVCAQAAETGSCPLEITPAYLSNPNSAGMLEYVSNVIALALYRRSLSFQQFGTIYGTSALPLPSESDSESPSDDTVNAVEAGDAFGDLIEELSREPTSSRSSELRLPGERAPEVTSEAAAPAPAAPRAGSVSNGGDDHRHSVHPRGR